MKKNLLTIIILTLGILNMILTSIIVFTMVPTTMRVNNLLAKVASNIDLEIAANNEKNGIIDIKFEDIETYTFQEDLTVNLKKGENVTKNHYIQVSISLSINTKSPDYSSLSSKIVDNETYIIEIIAEELGKYTEDSVRDFKSEIKTSILTRIQNHFGSDFIFDISLGKFITQ